MATLTHCQVDRRRHAAVLDVGAERFGDPQSVQGEKRDEGVVAGSGVAGGDKDRAELVAVQPHGVGLVVQVRAAYVERRRALDQAVFGGVAVQASAPRYAARNAPSARRSAWVNTSSTGTSPADDTAVGTIPFQVWPRIASQGHETPSIDDHLNVGPCRRLRASGNQDEQIGGITAVLRASRWLQRRSVTDDLPARSCRRRIRGWSGSLR